VSLWSRISTAIAALANGEPLSVVFDALRTPPERSIAFTIAVIALGAKMAKADGRVTRDEVTAFRQVFHIAQPDLHHAAKVFDMARQDVAGFDIYAQRISAMFGAGHQSLRDLLEGLFYIAVADGRYHPNENSFLERVAEIFGITAKEFSKIKMQFVPDAAPDPYAVLGLEEGADHVSIRRAWKSLVREYHPDQMTARGVPAEAVKLAEHKLIQINRAYETLIAGRP
jgi:DnaJ like chaperone protein